MQQGPRKNPRNGWLRGLKFFNIAVRSLIAAVFSSKLAAFAKNKSPPIHIIQTRKPETGARKCAAFSAFNAALPTTTIYRASAATRRILLGAPPRAREGSRPR